MLTFLPSDGGGSKKLYCEVIELLGTCPREYSIIEVPFLPQGLVTVSFGSG